MGWNHSLTLWQGVLLQRHHILHNTNQDHKDGKKPWDSSERPSRPELLWQAVWQECICLTSASSVKLNIITSESQQVYTVYSQLSNKSLNEEHEIMLHKAAFIIQGIEKTVQVNVIYYKYISYLGESRDYFLEVILIRYAYKQNIGISHQNIIFCQENTYCLRNLKQTFQDWQSDKSCQISSLGTLNEVRWTDDREDRENSCASLARGTCCLDSEMESELTYCSGPGVSPHLVISGNSRLWPGF